MRAIAWKQPLEWFRTDCRGPCSISEAGETAQFFLCCLLGPEWLVYFLLERCYRPQPTMHGQVPEAVRSLLKEGVVGTTEGSKLLLKWRHWTGLCELSDQMFKPFSPASIGAKSNMHDPKCSDTEKSSKTTFPSLSCLEEALGVCTITPNYRSSKKLAYEF